MLAVCADAFEARAWVNACGVVRVPNWRMPYAERTTWNGVELYVVANGPGPGLAEEAVRKAESYAGEFDGLMSVGLCGALEPGMKIGDVCTATEVSDGETTWSARPVAGARAVRLLSVDRFLGTPAEKAEWFGRGYGAVEMEAAAVARCAAERRLPFVAVKAVSDTADDRFAIDFNAYRDDSGRFSRGRIAMAALLHPVRYMPDLYHMVKRGIAAAESLGAFLVQSRF